MKVNQFVIKKNRHRRINYQIKIKKESLIKADTSVPSHHDQDGSLPGCIETNDSVTNNMYSENAFSENQSPTGLMDENEKNLFSLCRKFGVPFEFPLEGEVKDDHDKRLRRIKYKLKKQETKCEDIDIPDAPPECGNIAFDRALDHIRAFEIKQMSYKLNHCCVCHERRIDMKMASETMCQRCKSDKMQVKMFSRKIIWIQSLYPMN